LVKYLAETALEKVPILIVIFLERFPHIMHDIADIISKCPPSPEI
jgi:hypothetical protein